MITLEHVYLLVGAMMAGVALLNAIDAENPKRYRSATFWGIYAVTFLFGTRLPSAVSGTLVIAMALVAGIGGLGRGRDATASSQDREASARRWGNRLFLPALLVPAVTLAGSAAFKRAGLAGRPIADPKQATLIALAIAAIVALSVAMAMLRPPLRAPIAEARRLLDTIGWAAVLPQMLAALGALFAAAGVGQVISGLASRWIAVDSPLAVVATYTIGMALFTMIMGNAFAAFPVMTAGIGLPLIVHRFGGDPTIMAAIGMLSGFCGTLMTPMAANFNVVPAALLELHDQNAVIKAQVPTALLLLVVNTVLMYLLVFSV